MVFFNCITIRKRFRPSPYKEHKYKNTEKNLKIVELLVYENTALLHKMQNNKAPEMDNISGKEWHMEEIDFSCLYHF